MSWVTKRDGLPAPICGKCSHWVGLDAGSLVYRCSYTGCREPFIGKELHTRYIHDNKYTGPTRGFASDCGGYYAYILDFLERTKERGLEGPTLDVGGYNGPWKMFFEEPYSVNDSAKPILDDGIIHEPSSSYGTVVCMDTLEHLRNPIKAFSELVRISSRSLVVIVPMAWGCHIDPEDCWRILPDGLEFLVRANNLNAIEFNILEFGDNCASLQLYAEKK